MPPVLEFKNITKVFPGVIANDKICFSLEKGEILALLGENGAGKTTLMNVLYSLYQPDEGEIIIEGEKVTFNSPCDAIDKTSPPNRLGGGTLDVLSRSQRVLPGQTKGCPAGSTRLGQAFGSANERGNPRSGSVVGSGL